MAHGASCWAFRAPTDSGIERSPIRIKNGEVNSLFDVLEDRVARLELDAQAVDPNGDPSLFGDGAGTHDRRPTVKTDCS